MVPFITDWVTVEQGWAELKKFVHDHIERLQERKELMGYREELRIECGDRQRAVGLRSRRRKAEALRGPERSDLQRDRSPAAALKQERRKHGEECGIEINPPGAPAEEHEI